VRRRLASAREALADLPYWLRVRRLGAGSPREYRRYLRGQLRRTLSKRDNDPGVGARLLIERLAAECDPAGAAVLCVGCRNGVELDEFRSRAFRRVVGIDLFSQREDIEVMDMHDLRFADDSFDVVYSSHSLEHAYDVHTVVREMMRVARAGGLAAVEVPVRHQADPADRASFAGLADLRKAFAAYTDEELLAEEEPPRSPTNDQGSDVARLVFRIRKDAGNMLRR
jgi:SAM-dependent methyltransferase